jgi:tetratricopeptide (TPR) repeat protein
MNKKNSFIIVIGCIVLVSFIKLALDIPYRQHIPSLPDDLKTLAPTLQEQITAASRKAYIHPSSGNLGMLGMVYHSCAKYDQAVECYMLAIKKDKSEWKWNYYLGCLKHEMSEPTAAIENFRAVIEKNRKAYQAWYYIGEGLQKQGKKEESSEAFGNILHLQNNTSKRSGSRVDYFPLGIYVRFQMARLNIDQNQLDRAEKSLKEIIDNNQLFGPAYRLLGTVYSLKGDSALGTSYTTRASDMTIYSTPIDTMIDKLALLSRSESFLLKQIDEAIGRKYPDWALRLINNGLQYFPDNRYLVSKAIFTYIKSDQVEKTLPLIKQHINAFKDDFVELKNVGYMYYQRGFFPQSEIYYEKAAAVKPDDSDVQFCLVLCYWKEGNKSKALEKINSLVEKNSRDSKVLASGINALLYIGEKDKAAAYLPKLRQIAPNDPVALKVAGMVAESKGNLQEAANLYEAAFRGNAEELSTVIALEHILILQKRWEKAISMLKEALKDHTNDPVLLERLGTLLVLCPDPKYRDIQEGLNIAGRAFTNQSSRPSTVVSAGKALATAYAKLGDKVNARAVMNLTLNVARQENVPEPDFSELEHLLSEANH